MNKKLSNQEVYKQVLSDRLLMHMDVMQESIDDFREGRMDIFEFKRIVDYLSEDTTKVANLTEYIKSTEV